MVHTHNNRIIFAFATRLIGAGLVVLSLSWRPCETLGITLPGPDLGIILEGPPAWGKRGQPMELDANA